MDTIQTSPFMATKLLGSKDHGQQIQCIWLHAGGGAWVLPMGVLAPGESFQAGDVVWWGPIRSPLPRRPPAQSTGSRECGHFPAKMLKSSRLGRTSAVGSAGNSGEREIPSGKQAGLLAQKSWAGGAFTLESAPWKGGGSLFQISLSSLAEGEGGAAVGRSRRPGEGGGCREGNPEGCSGF